MKRIVFISALSMFSILVFAQGDFQSFYKTSQGTNTIGMYVLGGWAIGNLATGAVGWSKSSGSEKYFHQMNFLWNTVNLGIAAYGLYAASQLNPLRMSSQEIINSHLRYEHLFLINGGLDIVYMGTGLLLKQYSQKSIKRPDLLLGYGNSLLLQGGFLFLFDGIMYLIQRSERMKFLNDFNMSLLTDGAMFQFVHAF